MNCKILFLLVFLISTKYLSAQSLEKTDTIELARKFGYSKNYQKAVSLLKQFEINHPKDINAVRLHGQILYWMKDFDTALSLYESALKINPNPYVQLDYGRMLFELNHLQNAKEVLEDYLKTNPLDVEALNSQGTIAYWQGEPKLARKYFQKVLDQYPKNDWALKYTDEINEAILPYLKISGAYASDSQPLSSVTGNIESGWYQSNLLAPKFIAQIQDFTASGNQTELYSFQGSNKFSFAGGKFAATITAGAYKSPADNSTSWTGKLELDQKLSSSFSISAFADRKPYFYTLSSLQQAVTENTYGIALALNKPESWMGWAGYNQQQFMDNNVIQSYGAWLLTPPLKLSDLSFYIGYAANYSNANKDQYIATSTVNQVLLTNNFNGIYMPYFTPKNQLETSVLASISFKPSSSFKFSVNSRIGVYTTADKPYFYLNYSASNQLIIQKDFYSQKYVPVEINGKLNYDISQKTSLEVGYTYLKTFFYNSNIARLGLNFKF
ncbi:MAG: hypothetical protein JWR54_2405 [Mucilaginibacter sp.]|nr:hypothetical protein [Mucilaginibacter sp.]